MELEINNLVTAFLVCVWQGVLVAEHLTEEGQGCEKSGKQHETQKVPSFKNCENDRIAFGKRAC